MKSLLFICSGLISSLFATKINPEFPAELQSPPLKYLEHTAQGDRFKIQFTGGMIFDACACGCEKDAEESLSRWHPGDEIELYPFAEDPKGFIYLLKNLENDTDVYSWIKDTPSTVRLPQFIGPGETPNTIKTGDGMTWLYTDDMQIDTWERGNRIFSCKNAFLHPSEFILINFDSKEQRHIKAFQLSLGD